MATDPAVQAAANAYADLAKQRGLAKRVLTVADTIDVIVAAVTPLIRVQAFTEAADAIEAESKRTYLTIPAVTALVRGLGEETENA